MPFKWSKDTIKGKKSVMRIFLLEELSTENKRRFRELVRKYHPDTGGDEENAKKIINAKNSDEKVESLYRELILKRTTEEPKSKKYYSDKEQSSSSKDTPFSYKWKEKFSSEQERDEWHEKVKSRRRKRQEKARRKQRR